MKRHREETAWRGCEKRRHLESTQGDGTGRPCKETRECEASARAGVKSPREEMVCREAREGVKRVSKEMAQREKIIGVKS